MGRRVRGTLPQVRLHKPTGSGRVCINGQTFTVGRYGSAEARHRYLEILAEHGIEVPAELAPAVAPTAKPKAKAGCQPIELVPLAGAMPADITVGEVCTLYLRDIKAAMPEGRRCGRYEKAKAAVRALRRLALMPADRFGTRALLDVRRRLLDHEASGPGVGKARRLSRGYINDLVKHVRRVFEWAVLHELVSDDRVAALRVVKPLKPGETKARETKRRRRVAASVVEATLPYLTNEVAGIVLFMRYTGCRPSEAARLKLCRITGRDRRVWRYRPGKHKTAHHGKQRDVFIGPKAQQVVSQHARDLGEHEYVFSPKRSVARRVRKDGTVSLKLPKGSPLAGAMFTKDRIRQAIHRAVDRANVQRQEKGLEPLPHWTPYQLRYLRLWEVRRYGGKEAAQATAGHTQAAMTDHYASADWRRAAKASLATG